MPRRFKRLLCRLLIGILLFAQMAVAAYACPQLSPTGFGFSQPSTVSSTSYGLGGPASQNSVAAGALAAPPVAGMPPCCDGMGQSDPSNPNLCAGHCQFGQQSDQTQTPTLPAALLTSSFYIVFPVPELTVSPRPIAASADIHAAASPPHAILHCCFRI